MSEEFVWSDRKRIIFGLPWSFTRYRLTEKKILIETGFLSRHEEEIRLYRVLDLTLKRSLWQRIFGVGTIHCCSGDKSTPEFDLKWIKNPREVKEMLSDMIDEERMKRKVGVREYMSESEGEDDFHDSDHDD